MKTKASLLIIVTLASIAAIAKADSKHYSGLECVAAGTDQSMVRYDLGRVYNTSTSAKGFYCGVVLDYNAISSSGTWIALWDRNYSSNFSCSLRSQSSTTSSYYYKTAASSGTSSGPVRYGFSGSSGYHTDGIRYIYCSVPGAYGGNQSAIAGYKVNEG